MMDDDKLVRLTVIPMLKTLHRRQTAVLVWVAFSVLLSVGSIIASTVAMAINVR